MALSFQIEIYSLDRTQSVFFLFVIKKKKITKKTQLQCSSIPLTICKSPVGWMQTHTHILISPHFDSTKHLFLEMYLVRSTTVEPHYNEVLGTMKITLLYQVFHIRVKKQRNIKSWDQQNYLVIRGFCYIRPLYNEISLYS